MELNRLIAKLGLASRRKANELIKNRQVKVNNQIVEQFTFAVNPKDKLTINGVSSLVKGSENFSATVQPLADIYLLLHKPIGYITSAKDPFHKKVVYNLLPKKYRKLHYLGRLDQNTSGVLLFSNDGKLTEKLTHPRKKISKKYQLTTTEIIARQDIRKLQKGIMLDDGIMKVDKILVSPENNKEITLEIHSGKKRIIRRMLMHLGYTIIKLERVAFADITTKKLAVGAWRFLTSEEIKKLKEI